MTDKVLTILDRLDLDTLIRGEFPEARATGNGLQCRCPFHEDDSPSLSVCVSGEDRGLFKCHACGTAGDFVSLLGRKWGSDFKATVERLESRAGIVATSGRREQAPQPSTGVKVRSRCVATFIYHDAEGKRLYWKKRFEPGFDGKRKKDFAFYHRGPDGKELKGRKGKAVPYNLHKLAQAPAGELIFFTEGEAKADALTAWGLVATSLDSGGQSGQGSAWNEECNRYLEGRTVYILPDHDAPGETYAATIAAHLAPVAGAVYILRLPGLEEKQDILDWIQLNRGAASE